MYKINIDTQELAIRMLSEGNSIRSVERLTGAHRDTIMRLMVRVGDVCLKLLDEKMRNLPCERIEVDEVWTFVGKKQARLRKGDNRAILGDQWIFTALDPESKIIPVHVVGKRSHANTDTFIESVARRMRNRVQLSSDGFSGYANAIDYSFGGNVDYGQVVKEYEAEEIGPGRYAPPRVSAVRKAAILGNPDKEKISTSLVENTNLQIRMRCRRLTRLTNAFSKKVENLRAAVALYMLDYNFIRRHGSIRMTPAMKAGISDRAWTWREVLEQVAW